MMISPKERQSNTLTTKTQALAPALRWDSSVRYLKGVGPEKERLLSRLDVRTLGELLGLFPRRHEKRFPVKKISGLTFEGKECVSGIVTSRAVARFGGRSLFRAVISNAAGPGERPSPPLFATFYNQPYLLQIFKPKQHIILYGAAEKKGKRIEMAHPEYQLFEEEPPSSGAHHGRWVPVYPLTEDLGQKWLRQTIQQALEKYSGLVPETFKRPFRDRLGLMEAVRARRQIHFPDDEAALEAARERLVFEEFFHLQLLVEKKRVLLRRERAGIAHAAAREDLRSFLGSLPFELTEGQRGAVEDIVRDMRSARPMNRLVQGDVGSGKTAVAAAALYFTVRSGFQGAMMAPTEVLAQQLYLNLTQLLAPFDVRVGYLAQSVQAGERAALCRSLESGENHIVVGTHALLQGSVRFKKLGLAIVDEQHKFGAAQRGKLRHKAGEPVHYLVLSATPIPRTLAMTLYGDMDLSVIAEKPRGRRPVRTLWLSSEQRPAVYRWLDSVLGEGARAFVVCPWIKNATAHHEALKKAFQNRRVALLHGRMKHAEKTALMRAFSAGQKDILVSTVLIEVGVDVPEARFMLIENAENFGLAQLHQLRGRVGRGEGDSFCVLFSDSDSPETAQRLEAFVGTDSGFEVAEKDLARRGEGEWHGEKQHGLLKFRLGDLARDGALMEKAKREARMAVEKETA